MEAFNVINQEYIPYVDIETLGQSFNTLEQGHQQAVQAATTLRTTVANLDMDSSEDGFKQQLINEIESTIDSNTIYGNSYYALDDLVTMQGNIASDGRIIGRLRNNQLKKQFDAKVDAMNISDGMKEMYKELNPYYYKDGEVDAKTGRVLPGEEWEANRNPVTQIPITTIQNYALQIAAKDAGGYNKVTFLDENGNEVSDASLSADGAIYRNINGKYEKLSKEKIAEAYRIAIDSIPGARDSLRQDYDYAIYSTDKLIEKAKTDLDNGNINLEEFNNQYAYLNNGIYDKNGGLFSYDQWLTNKINGFATVTAYNHTYTDVSYGNALENYRARQAKASAAQTSYMQGLEGVGSFIGANIDIKSNSFMDAGNLFTTTNSIAMNTVTSTSGETFADCKDITEVLTKIINDGNAKSVKEATDYYLSTYGQSMDNISKLKFRQAAIAAVDAKSTRESIISKVDEDTRRWLLFGEDLITEEYGTDNSYSKAILSDINKLKNVYPEGLSGKIGNDVLKELAKIYGLNNVNEFNDIGLNIKQTDSDYVTMTIAPENYNKLPRLFYSLEEADDAVPGSFGGWWVKNFSKGVSKGNYKFSGLFYNFLLDASDNRSSSASWHSGAEEWWNPNGDFLNGLANVYRRGLEKQDEIMYNFDETITGTRTLEAYSVPSYAAIDYMTNNYGLDTSTNNAYIKRANEQVYNVLSNGQLDAGYFRAIDKNGQIIPLIGEDASKARAAVANMVSSNSNDVTVSAIKPILDIKNGYMVSFKVPKDTKILNFEEGDNIRLIVANANIEGRQFDPSNNSVVMARNIMLNARTVNGRAEMFNGYNETLGDTAVEYIRPTNSYEFNLFGCTRQLDSATAEQVIIALRNLQTLKYNYQSGLIQSEDGINRIQSEAAIISDYISQALNIDYNIVELGFYNYLNN